MKVFERFRFHVPKRATNDGSASVVVALLMDALAAIATQLRYQL